MTNDSSGTQLLRDAAQQLGIDDLVALKRTAKKAGCYFDVCGLDYIDVEALKVYLDAEVAAAMQRRRQKRNGPNEYALVKARLTMYPKWHEEKEAKIASLREKAKAAANAYEEDQLRKKIERLQKELARTHANEERDMHRMHQLIRQAEAQRLASEVPPAEAESTKPASSPGVRGGRAYPIRNPKA